MEDEAADLDDGGDAQCRTIAAGGSVILMSINVTSIWIAMSVLCVSILSAVVWLA